jgi:hypothetical protein
MTLVTDSKGRQKLVDPDVNSSPMTTRPNDVAVLFDVHMTYAGRIVRTWSYVVFRVPEGETADSILAKFRPDIESAVRSYVPGSVPFPTIGPWMVLGSRQAPPNTGQRLTSGLGLLDLALGAGVVLTAAGFWKGRRRIWAGLNYSRSLHRVSRSCCPQCDYEVDPALQRRCPECGHELHGYDWPRVGDQADTR